MFTLTPPPEIYHVDVQPIIKEERGQEMAPRSPSSADEWPCSAAELPQPARTSPPSSVRRKFTVSRQTVREASSSPRLTLKFQHVKTDESQQLNTNPSTCAPSDDVITNRCAVP